MQFPLVIDGFVTQATYLQRYASPVTHHVSFLRHSWNGGNLVSKPFTFVPLFSSLLEWTKHNTNLIQGIQLCLCIIKSETLTNRAAVTSTSRLAFGSDLLRINFPQKIHSQIIDCLIMIVTQWIYCYWSSKTQIINVLGGMHPCKCTSFYSVHCSDVIIGVMASQITAGLSVC